MSDSGGRAAQPDRDALIALMLRHGVLRFGDFTLKSGRRSPYFFNLGAIDDGPGLAALGHAYADTVVAHGIAPEVVFGPAYKGIPIAVTTAIALASRHGIEAGVSFNRKEAKAHGEGGQLIGRPLNGRVVIVDDVMTAGTAVHEAAALVATSDASLTAIIVALDRQELLPSGVTAVQEVARVLNVPVISIVSLRDVIAYLEATPGFSEPLAAIRRYQREHCQP
jgi:orotate phosphoribosyltransferase